ncbi:fascin domain-containing protein [Variovorax sp. tm]|uniref:fascin domain-containing protein n=1 Tax=Variovorax atrisoli TaxID=3394203 RepID=UPI003A7F8A3E
MKFIAFLILQIASFFALGAQGQVIDQYILPPGTKATYFAIRSLANQQFVAARADGTLQAQDLYPSPSSLFSLQRVDESHIAIFSASAGKWVTAENAGGSPLTANRTAVSVWERFEVVDLGGGNIALRADANRSYVTAESGGTAPLIANRLNPSTWETFKIMPVIDMAQVLSSFADLHPNEGKLKTFRANQGTSYFNNQSIAERRLAGKNEIITTQTSFDGVRIYDWIWLATDQVGGHGTFPICPGCAASIWSPMIPLSRRYVTPDMVGAKIQGTVSVQNADGSTLNFSPAGQLTTGNEIHEFGVQEMNGNMGARWFIKISTDVATFPGHIKEYYTYDLGPAVNVYAPEFGQIMYEQTNKPGNGGDATIEKYGEVTPMEIHATVSNLFAF